MAWALRVRRAPLPRSVRGRRHSRTEVHLGVAKGQIAVSVCDIRAHKSQISFDGLVKIQSRSSKLRTSFPCARSVPSQPAYRRLEYLHRQPGYARQRYLVARIRARSCPRSIAARKARAPYCDPSRQCTRLCGQARLRSTRASMSNGGLRSSRPMSVFWTAVAQARIRTLGNPPPPKPDMRTVAPSERRQAPPQLNRLVCRSASPVSLPFEPAALPGNFV